jgi:hypothetical protein
MRCDNEGNRRPGAATSGRCGAITRAIGARGRHIWAMRCDNADKSLAGVARDRGPRSVRAVVAESDDDQDGVSDDTVEPDDLGGVSPTHVAAGSIRAVQQSADRPQEGPISCPVDAPLVR